MKTKIFSFKSEFETSAYIYQTLFLTDDGWLGGLAYTSREDAEKHAVHYKMERNNELPFGHIYATKVDRILLVK